jgi:hypothetical protein
MPRFLKSWWHHDLPDEPVLLYSHVDDAGMEVRKIEIYRDGRRDWADEAHATGETRLSETEIPSVEEIDDQPEFDAIEISADEFQTAWLNARES